MRAHGHGRARVQAIEEQTGRSIAVEPDRGLHDDEVRVRSAATAAA